MAFTGHPETTDPFGLSDFYLASETDLIPELVSAAALSDQQRQEIAALAQRLISGLRKEAKQISTVDAFLREYGLSTQEGVILMRLAESLIRTPDHRTASYLVRDKIGSGNWGAHLNTRNAVVALGTLGLNLCKSWIGATGGARAPGVLARLGDPAMLTSIRLAMGLLGRHFVLGTSIENAIKRASKASQSSATFSYDMLGEAAMTAEDATKFFVSYTNALKHLAETTASGTDLHSAPGLSVKLSALHPRYEFAKAADCVPILTARLIELAERAKAANLGLTIDAEEAERLEVSLMVFENLLAHKPLGGWDGLGIAVQAYQRRAIKTVDWIASAAKRHNRRITVRLVKGAYWDSEIKRAQELGLESYPVFTRKENTDLSYLACARKLLNAEDHIYPQFATHNAHTAAAIVKMAGERRDLEFQRLHGMSDGLHNALTKEFGFASRTYAPVGRHKELLPYLVRRLLENGANSSFVNQLLDADCDLEDLVRDPIQAALANTSKAHPGIPAPRDILNGERSSAAGHDLTQASTIASIERLPQPQGIVAIGAIDHSSSEYARNPVVSPSDTDQQVGAWHPNAPGDVEAVIRTMRQSDWPLRAPGVRANTLRRAADMLEARKHDFMSLCVSEAGKTWNDAEAEIREAVDFLRYYADQSERIEIKTLSPLGTVACISPWNFPLAIFLGQVSAALSVGNRVIAKPAEQTPLIAYEAVNLLHEAGVPEDGLCLLFGGGEVGGALVAHPGIDGVCFTGSTATAKRIHQSLAKTDRGESPLIAETGGINAMIVDSTALLEQAVRDVLISAFQSAGQRCSACRLVCIQEDIADDFITMLRGAMADWVTGDPRLFSSDAGPVIDALAKERIDSHISDFKARFKLIAEGNTPTETNGYYVHPTAFEIDQISDLKEEIFGPVLHVVRFSAKDFESTVQEINALGFGLTMGLHTRIDDCVDKVSAIAHVGNLYVNRNQIGAVVSVQPFGGHGLSGTGPKAGGPNYLRRLCETGPVMDLQPVPKDVFLPGPTGEKNTLFYRPRGKLLCLGGDDESVLAMQLDKVRLTGNEPVLLGNRSIECALKAEQVDGIVSDSNERHALATLLSNLPGPILPMLSTRDPIERFYIEQVVTVDTTAAGGNASLLSSV